MTQGGWHDRGAHSPTLAGTLSYSVYLPPGYGEGFARCPAVYLLHGRGDTHRDWHRVRDDVDDLIAGGRIPPLLLIAPDAPWSDRAGYYVDSLYSGSERVPAGRPIASALVSDLVAHVDRTYRTTAGRGGRVIAGYSMGGAGAVSLLAGHPDVFSAAIGLSPAVYVPSPPAESSARQHGAYGVGRALFDPERYAALNYPARLAALDGSVPVRLNIDVGENEIGFPDPADAAHAVQREAAALFELAKRTPGVAAGFRHRPGGHDWGTWKPAFRQALIDIAGHLFEA